MQQADYCHSLDVQVIDSFEGLELLKPDWEALLARCSRPSPMLTPMWALSWWRNYHSQRSLAVGVFRDGDRVVGIAPFCHRTIHYKLSIPFRRLEVLGASSGEADGVCGEYLGLVVEPGRERDVAAAFVGSLEDGAFGQFDEVVIEFADTDAAETSALIEAMGGSRLVTSCETSGQAHYLSLPASWNEFLDAQHGKRRHWFRRTWSAFEAWVGDQGFHVRQASTPEDVETGMRILSELHGERWSHEGMAGAFASDRFARFHLEYAKQLLPTGCLALSWLVVGNTPVAAHYSIISGDKLYFYQSGRKMDVPANVRLGIIMFMLAIQEAMARGLKEYDFLAGDSPYKSYFTKQTRPLSTLRAARRSLREATRATLQSAIDLIQAHRARGRNSIEADAEADRRRRLGTFD